MAINEDRPVGVTGEVDIDPNSILSYEELDERPINLADPLDPQSFLMAMSETVIPGEIKHKRFLVRNNHPKNVVELIPFSKTPNITIDRAPKQLGSGQAGPVDVSFIVPEVVSSPPKGQFGFDLIVLETSEETFFV